MTEDNHLTGPAASLARSAPHAWEAFKEAFRAYEAAAKESLVKADPTQIFKVQGAAQQCSTLARIFEDAIPAADRMAARRNPGR